MAKNPIDTMIVKEIFLKLSSFTRKETFLGYVKLSITRDLFETEPEYEEFYNLLGNFHELMMRGNETYTSGLIIELQNSFKTLMRKFPNQTDRLILETIYEARKSSQVPNALNYISKKNVVSTQFTLATFESKEEPVVTMGMISSSTITKYLDDGKLSKGEQYFCDTFFSNEKGKEMFKLLSPSDIARCVQDTRMIPAVYFSISNILEATEKEEERLELITQYIYGDIRNFNLDKLKLILYYRQIKEKTKLNEFNTTNIEMLEHLRQECGAILPNTPMILGEETIIVPDLTDKQIFDINLISASTGTILPAKSVSRQSSVESSEETVKNNVLNVTATQSDFSKIDLLNLGKSSQKIGAAHVVESMVQDFPIFAVTTDKGYNSQTILLPDEGTISKKIMLKEMDDLILSLKLDQIIKIYRDEIQKRSGDNTQSEIDVQKANGYKYVSIRECLKGINLTPEILKIFISRIFMKQHGAQEFPAEILEKREQKDVEPSVNEFMEKFDAEKRAIMVYLFNEKLFSFANIIEMDFSAVCASVENGEILVTSQDLAKSRLTQKQKEALINIAITNHELLQALLNSNNINKNDIMTLNIKSYIELVPLLYNRNILNNTDLILLMKQGKITLSDIDGFDLENIHVPDSEIVLRYAQIYEKKLEYEAAVQANYEQSLQAGISEEDIQESAEEIKLREELQELTYLKDLYITLFKKQEMTQLEEYHRRQDIYMEVIELCYADDNFEKSIADITNMLYTDNFISMAQVQQFDDSLFIPILKSGMAKRDDIEKFKSEIVSVEEVEKIRAELSEIVEGEELEEEVRKQVYVLTYNKLSELMEKIISDSNSSKEEKLSILYSIFYKNNETEKTHRDFFETEILVKIYSKLKQKRQLPVINPDDEKESDEPEKEEKDDNKPGTKSTSKEYVYPTNIIWKFIELLDSDFKFRILADGYVLFESEKLNKVFIENVWQANKEGDFVRRGYGATTLILDLNTYKMHQTDIVKPGRHGYKVDVLKAKSYLPQIQTTKGSKPTGMIIHEKDLKNTGKKVWFELILEHLGITEANVNAKTTSYTQEDLDKINSFIMSSRFKYEELTK